MAKPFFSIIIPTLNEEEYLPRLLDDLREQKERSFEVVVIDGGSSDRTVEIATRYTHKLPFTLITGQYRNVCVQRNLGGGTSSGKYIIFFDADVQIPPRFLSLVKTGIEKHTADFYTTWIKADSKLMYDQIIAHFFNVGVELALLFDKQFVGGYNFIISRSAFNAIGGFREDIKHAEDLDLSMRLSKAYYRLEVLKQPKLIFSLRRYRTEGRLSVVRKMAKAGLHIVTKGPITSEIFDYPMGGGWYRSFTKENLRQVGLKKAELYMKRLAKLFFE